MRKIYSLCLFLHIVINGVTAQNLKVNFDYSNAEKTLEYLISRDTTQVEEILSLEPTKALLQKINMTDAEAKNSLVASIEGNPKNDNYQLSTVKKHSQDLGVFVKQIKNNQDNISASVTDSLGKYMPLGKDMSITVHFLLGGFSSGFTMGDDQHFYIGLHHYKNDLVSVENSCIHELFHNIQSANYDLNTVIGKLKEDDLGLTYVYAMLGYIYLEGSASYIADLNELGNENPHIKDLKEHAMVNKYREQDVFYLISRMLADANSNPEKVQFGNLYNILMDWNWNNPGYFVGYTMMKALEKNDEKSMAKYIKMDPVYFFDDYIRLSYEKDSLPKFSSDFEEIINVLKKKIDLL